MHRADADSDRLMPLKRTAIFLVLVLAASADASVRAQRLAAAELSASLVVLSTAVSQLPPSSNPQLAQAQAAHSQAVALEQANNPGCVDLFYQAIENTWQMMAATAVNTPSQPVPADAWVLYHDSLARLIRLGQQHGRLDPRSGLRVNTAAGAVVIPTRYFGFTWQPGDFHQLLVAGEYRTEKPRQIFRRPGLGVPLIAVRYQNGNFGFLKAQHPFAATVVLRPANVGVSAVAPMASPQGTVVAPVSVTPTLDFYDSLTVRQVPFAGREIEMAADTTAPLAWSISRAPPQRLRDRLQPGTNTNPPELFFLEPYRPGRIPIVFVHGLLSEPSTWADLANDIHAIQQINDRFQVWAFRYPTTDPFLQSAAALRRQLCQAVGAIDPLGTQPALQHMVLVGHSMGGLVSKLQVTQGGDAFWSHIANRPLEAIVADERTKATLRDEFFFQPQPFVRRVVFIATPHGGSTLASQWIGRFGSWMVKPSAEQQRAHQLLKQYNPNTFSPSIERRFPNSIDLLEPQSPLLAAMRQMPINPQVRLHSIIGHGYPMLTSGDADSVVPVSSARHAGVQTETFVRAKHTEIHHQPETLQALLYILSVHYAEYEAEVAR